MANNTLSKRYWLSYSHSKDSIFCISCKLFGLPKAQKCSLALNGSNDWSNILRTINNHEHSPNHIQSEISRGLYLNSNRVDLNNQLNKYENREVANNRETFFSYSLEKHFSLFLNSLLITYFSELTIENYL